MNINFRMRCPACRAVVQVTERHEQWPHPQHVVQVICQCNTLISQHAGEMVQEWLLEQQNG